MRFFSYFSFRAPVHLVYMLQQVEYSSKGLIAWILKFPDLRFVQKRQALAPTPRAMITVSVTYATWLVWCALTIWLAAAYSYFWLGLLLFSPDITIGASVIFNTLLGSLIVGPREAAEIKAAAKKLHSIKADKIAILGSYGKTSLKEILGTVLASGKKVAATPGNRNILISHARWVTYTLKGDEEVLIFEFGESKPGDIRELAGFSKPSTAVITGLAPAHMEGYETLDDIARDFQVISDFVPSGALYFNGESPELVSRIRGGKTYDSRAVGDWTVSHITMSIEGISFEMKKDKRNLKLKSGLIGHHNVGALALAVAIADRLQLTDAEIIEGVSRTKPFKHRMQPYQLQGAWIIDDTYNGNLEGMRSGLQLLKELPGKRKIYVTPGLVEQGSLKKAVHIELGNKIAAAAPDRVVLMENSTTPSIKKGLEQGGYTGELIVEKEPLNFYTQLEHYIASGDLVLLQNDWTDNYL